MSCLKETLISLELRELRTKVTVETDCALDAYAAAHSLDKTEVAREVLHKWAEKQMHASTLLQSRLKREGLSGADKGVAGQARPDEKI